MADNDKPQEKPTTKLDKDEITRQLLDKVLLKLNEVGSGQDEFRTGLATLGGKVDILVASHQVVSNDVDTIKSEQVAIREWKGAIEERFKTHSMRAKQESVHDESQDVKLQELENRLTAATESSVRAAFATMTKAAEAAAKTPLGQRVAKAAGYAALAFFGYVALYFGAMTAKPPQPATQSNVVQVSPVTVYADAGAE